MNPRRKTGLSTLFPEFVGSALRLFPDVDWILFAGPDQEGAVEDPRVEVCRTFPANDRLGARLRADHFLVAAEARRRGAAALLTVGFHPARTAGLPVVMHLFSLHHRGLGGARGAYRRWAVARGLKRAALVVVNSRWTASQLGLDVPLGGPPATGAEGRRAGSPAASPRVLVSPEGIQAGRFTPEGPAGLAGLPSRYVLWVSNFYPYKRAELALAAYARLAPEVRARHPFVLAGGDWGGGRARAEEKAARLGLGGDVRFLGWVSDTDLPALYRGASCHVLSTAEETFGRSVLEAMACGCPCIVQDLPVLREVAGEAAVFADFTSPERAAAALESILSNAALADRRRAGGIRRAAGFGFDRLARERVEVILKMLEASA